MNQQLADSVEAAYFPVSPLMILPETIGEFGVYLKLHGRFVLYAHPMEPFTENHRRRLYENGVEEIFILTKQRGLFNQYMENYLGQFLENEKTPIKERAKVFYKASADILKQTFESRLPANLDRKQYEVLFKYVTLGTNFLSKEDALKSMAPLISHDYQTFSHSVHVFLFATALLQTYNMEQEDLIYAGMGAILHDIGKTKIRKSILNKPGRLTKEEMEEIKTHPLKGVAVCANLPLRGETMNCILFHHERMDGKGYPSGVKGLELPLAVRAVSLADVYDALTTNRPYGTAKPPFEALSMMREEMDGQLDPKMFKRFVLVLSGADIV
ncbi:HD-GYP domain-containing protein [Dethiosulfatarculus sandiegensis]|uniref:HD family phosphohydrolase n=1 Tax=Dethiosulfatarculus sandiegensis TaxID=1429043 RepID=A0A0D2GJV8_9BACT|nr:HD domain-containing phosphohydrolase [Dethiosulfatarculus sandiegensis]KIX15012.1 HD family phosphohydrolase [Dethiosulfatarculus sandiegensis]